MVQSNFKIDKWLKDLQDIHDKVFFLWYNNKEFHKLKDRFNEKSLPFELFRFIRRNYVTFMCMGVRRLIDNDPQTTSLLRILEDIRDNSNAFNKSWFLEQHPDAPGEDLFEEFFGENGTLKKETASSDIEKLQWTTKKVKDYADKWEAHWDRQRFKVKYPNYRDLDFAVDSITEIYKRYYYLLKQSSLDFTGPL